MSEVKRFAMFGQHLEESGGQFVYASDYDKQAQEIERLSDRNCAIEDELARNLDYKALCSELRQEIERLNAELEQAKKAQGKVVAYMLANATGRGILEFQEGYLRGLQSRYGGEIVPLYTAPPAIPATQVLIGLEKFLDSISEFDPTYGEDTVPLNQAAEHLLKLRAILSSKGGDV